MVSSHSSRRVPKTTLKIQQQQKIKFQNEQKMWTGISQKRIANVIGY